VAHRAKGVNSHTCSPYLPPFCVSPWSFFNMG